MLLFKRIFSFDKAKVDQISEQRLEQRFTPGATFPLQAWLVAEDMAWPAKIINVSGNGIGLMVNQAAHPAKHQPAKVRLEIDSHQQEITADLVHVQPEDKGVYCGIGFNFENFIVQKIYLQLLQPVMIGQSLQPVADNLVIQNEPQLIKKMFRGEDHSLLNVWYAKTPGTPLYSFEFQMYDCYCRADTKVGVLEAYSREATDSFKGKLSNPVFVTSGEVHDDIRQLFRLILPNLSPSVPEDVRTFLQRFTG